MKTMSHQALLYDDNCPLCAAYTKVFIQTGLLEKQNRLAFSTINIQEFNMDINRARHEIPMVNLQTGTVVYGIDALAEILNQKIPFVKKLLGISWVHWFFKKWYSFISYNRKIIVAKPTFSKSCFDCSPDYSFKHRMALILFTTILSSYLLLQVASIYFSNIHREWFWGGVIIPLLLIIGKSKQQAADILVHSGITVLLSTIFFVFFAKIFSWLFTFSMLIMLLALAMASVVFIHQAIRRSRFYIKEQQG